MGDVTDRLQLPYPTGSDLIADGDDAIQQLAELLDDGAVVFMQGPFDSRPASSVQTPGVRGRLYYATDRGELYYDHGAGWVAIQEIPTGAITTDRLANGAVTTPKIADGAVTTPKLADEAVTDAKLASGAVTQPKLADGAVTQAKIADGAVTSGKLLANAVTSGKLADGAVTSQKLADGAVTAQKVASELKPSQGAAAGTEALRALGTGAGQACAGNDPRLSDQRTPVDGSVTTQKLSNGAVTSAKIADGAVTTPKLADEAVTDAKLASGAVTQPKLADGAVTQAKIADGAVTESKLALRIVRGVVAADGDWTGSGFEVQKEFEAGGYYVNFDDSFAQPPVVIVSADEVGFAIADEVIAGGFAVQTNSWAGSPEDLPFSFIAIGA